MAQWSDAEREFHEENRDKKRTAVSSHKQRTHCGKGGRVRLPSDNMTPKEIRAMSGECVTYNLKKPMDWETFKRMPEDLQKEYVCRLRSRFGCNNSAIADMLGTGRKNFQVYVGKLGLCLGKGSGNDAWDVVGFDRWKRGEEEMTCEEGPEAAVDAVREESVVPDMSEHGDVAYGKAAVPMTGSMDFEGDIHDICCALGRLLSGAKVTLEVSWHVKEDDHE